MPAQELVFQSHDITRIWQLTLAMYDAENPEADLRSFFAEALHTYLEFMEDLQAGGIEFEDPNGIRFVSTREVSRDGDTLRFVPVKEG